MLLDKYINHNTLYIVVGLHNIESGTFASGAWADGSFINKSINTSQSDASAISLISSEILEITVEIDGWLKKNPSIRIDYLRVLVADIWLPNCSVPWNSSSNASEALTKSFALNQLSYAGFEVEPADTVKFLEYSYGEPFLSFAYPDELMVSLNNCASMLGLKLTSVLPFSVAAWFLMQEKGSQSPVLGIYTDNLLIVADFSDGSSEVKTRILNEGGNNHFSLIQAEWKRIKIRAHHLAGVENLPLLDLSQSNGQLAYSSDNGLSVLDALVNMSGSNIPLSLKFALAVKNVSTSVDAITQGYTLTPLKWIVISIFLLCIGFLEVQIWQLNQQAAQIDSDIDNVLTNVNRFPVKDWTKQELVQIQAVNSTIRQLNLPFSSLMAALQPPRDVHIDILSLEIGADAQSSASASHIKIVAEAKTAGEMAQYVSFLSDRKLFTAVYLLRHEIVETNPNHPYRFDVDMLLEDQL